MRRVALSLISCLAVLLLINSTPAASPALRVNETTTKILLEERQASVSLVVKNSRHTPIAARVRVEIIDAQNRVRASAESEKSIRPGTSALAFFLDLRLSSLSSTEMQQVLWYRLSYKITPHSTKRFGLDSISGIISLSQITPDLFELKAIKPFLAVEGWRYRVMARAAHPVTSRPIKDVSIDAEIKLACAQRDSVLKASAVTDSDGYATFDFNLPADVTSSEGEIKLTGRRGVITKVAESTVRLDLAARIIISPDKRCTFAHSHSITRSARWRKRI